MDTSGAANEKLLARSKQAKRDSRKALTASRSRPAAEGDITVNLRYISDIDIELLPMAGGLVVRSPINTGKTRLAALLIARLRAWLGRPVRVLVIVHRRLLAQDETRRLNEEGLVFVCYLGLSKAELRQVDQLVICANSVPKLITRGGGLPTFDLVLIDESEQGLDHLGGGTFRKGEAIRVHETMRALVGSARLAVLMDAHAGDISQEWLREVRKPVMTLVNTCVVERGDLTLYDVP